MPDNSGDPAPVAGKGIYQLRPGTVGAHPGNTLHSTAQRLHKNRSIGSKAWLFRTDLSVVVLPHIQVFRLEHLEIRKTPNLIGDSAEDIVLMHRGVGGDNPIGFRKND